MGHSYRDDEDDEEYEEVTNRPKGPRFGPFVTIAVAILLLFGAISRIGKPLTDERLFGLDIATVTALQREEKIVEEQRNTTLLVLGATPTPPDVLRPPPQGIHSLPHAAPPVREDPYAYDYDDGVSQVWENPTSLSLPMPTEGHSGVDSLRPGGSSRFDPAPEAVPHQRQTSASSTYTVAQGDTWHKIGQRVGLRWQDLQKANPQAQSGLRIGMILNIP